MGERSFGARWWRDSLGIARLACKPALGTMGLLGALSLPACATTWEGQEGPPYTDAHDEIDVSVNALQLQRQEGWDVGQTGAALAFAGSSDVDAAGTQAWREAMGNLAGAMAPTAPALQPYYVPTLFQSLIGPAGQSLRAVMRPMHTADMDEDLARGVALRAQFGAVGWPKDTAIVVDAPGPRAVAVAAALADRFAPVFTFANWPHPLGVVPAHQTIAASLYYLPLFSAAAAVRPPDAPPMFVLDANRLAPYRDAAQEFDNRYFVKLPSAEQLAALGVRHLLYVSADGAGELDDLNAAFVALCGNGVDVKMLALSDFVRAGDEPAMAANEGAAPDGDDDGDDDAVQEGDAVQPSWMGMWHVSWLLPVFWYRGCWGPGMWSDYGWYHVREHAPMFPQRRGGIVVGPPTGRRAPTVGTHAAWSPHARVTMFTPSLAGAASAGHARFGGNVAFGHIPMRAARSDGHLVGFGSFHAHTAVSARSGSFGRSGGNASFGGG